MPSPQTKAKTSIKTSFLAIKFNKSKQHKISIIEIAENAFGISL